MREAGVSRQASSASSGAAAVSPSLPDINAETYPFDVVQRLLDRAAHFNLLSRPADACEPLAAPGGGIAGFRLSERLCRFTIAVPPPGPSGLRGRAAAGEPVGSFDQRWLLVPPDYRALPHGEPPAVAWDPTRSQRFVMLGGFCRLGDAGDAFRGFGTGLTFPRGGGRVDVAAVGTLLEGHGRLAGRVGTYTYCGTLDPARGFTGSLLLRVSDPTGELQTDGDLPPFAPSAEVEPGVSYLLLRGQKRGKSQHTAYRFGPGGDVIGLDVEQDVRLFQLDASPQARGGLKCLQRIGPIVGRMTARITFNLLNPEAPGTDLAPIPFASFNDFTFLEASGAVLGTLTADGVEGRTFQLALPGAPGQRALRFGGFGPVSGTGAFSGVSGLFTDNSAVGVAPHALATCYVFRLDDPEGRFRAPSAAA